MTFSIVAWDADTGALGAAVASRALAVGSCVPHVRAGVAAVVVQARAPLEWGPLALSQVASGASSSQVVADLQRLPAARRAQVALVDRSGRPSAFTGPDCEPEASIAFGITCVCAANLMEQAAVPEAVVAAFETAVDRTFAERLVLALAVGDALGGDIRGRQSAALAVSAPLGEGCSAQVDLRIDDSRDPVAELSRLLTLHRAHALVASSVDAAGHYRDVEPLLAAVALAPDDLGCVSALGLALIRAGRIDEALPHLTHLAAVEPRTVARFQRLIDTGHLDQRLGTAALDRVRGM